MLYFKLLDRAAILAAFLLSCLPLFAPASETLPALLLVAPPSVGIEVRFNPAALNLAPGGEAALALPRLGTLAVVHDRQEWHPDGSATWVGHFSGFGDDYRVVLTTSPGGGLAGRIVSPDGEFSLSPLPGGGARLLDRKAAPGAPVLVDAGDDTLSPPPSVQQRLTPRLAAAPSPHSTIDLMVVYTDGMARRYGSALQARLNNLVAITNQAYIDSGIHITLRLVYAVKVNYSDDVDLNRALSDISNGVGVFSNIPILRKRYGADLVQLIIAPKNKFCGGGKALAAVPVLPEYAYSTFYDHGNVEVNGCDNPDTTMAHELGHNMGAQHDRAHAAWIGGGVGTSPALGYGFGYGISGKFADIMSASYVRAPIVSKFSNPNITCGPDRDPCGIPAGLPGAADSARTLNDNREAVAAFMPTKVAVPTAKLTATPASVPYGGSATLSWSSKGATSCRATAPGWSGPAPASGRTVVKLKAAAEWTLACTGPGGTARAAASVEVGPSPSAACLFNWAERAYPRLFPLAGRGAGTWRSYAYRRYPAANAYLGVSSADQHVYYLGPDGRLQDEGPLSNWLPRAGCR